MRVAALSVAVRGRSASVVRVVLRGPADGREPPRGLVGDGVGGPRAGALPLPRGLHDERGLRRAGTAQSLLGLL